MTSKTQIKIVKQTFLKPATYSKSDKFLTWNKLQFMSTGEGAFTVLLQMVKNYSTNIWVCFAETIIYLVSVSIN
jgi:hypothetical protein